MANYFERAKFFRTKKRLGQNFLVDGEVIQDIIEFANISPEDTIVEIGPGVGFVTEQLVKYAKKVIAIELDEEAIKELKSFKVEYTGSGKKVIYQSPSSGKRIYEGEVVKLMLGG